MKGKNFYKKVFPWLGASFYFFPNKTLDFLNLIATPEEIVINAKAEEIESLDPSNQSFSEIENFNLQKYIQDLNQTEVYFLVTQPKNKKEENDILLLLQNENRLNSEPALTKRRSQYIQTKRIKKKNGKLVQKFKGKVKPREILKLKEILKLQKYSIKARFLTTAKSYNLNNLAGCKSICPLFFSKDTAEDFLLKTTKDTLARSNYRIGVDKGSKDTIKNILNSKIITIGLGDFLDYYSSPLNDKILDKIEFLFFPNVENLRQNTKKSSNSISTKSFNFYQNNYYKLKTVNRT